MNNENICVTVKNMGGNCTPGSYGIAFPHKLDKLINRLIHYIVANANSFAVWAQNEKNKKQNSKQIKTKTNKSHTQSTAKQHDIMQW